MALAMFASAHGRQVGYDEAASAMTLGRRGIDLLSISRGMAGFQLRTQAIHSSYDALVAVPLPAIAHLKRAFGAGHFVVLDSVTRSHVVVADPATGPRTLPRRAFCRRWSGYLLAVITP